MFLKLTVIALVASAKLFQVAFVALYLAYVEFTTKLTQVTSTTKRFSDRQHLVTFFAIVSKYSTLR